MPCREVRVSYNEKRGLDSRAVSGLWCGHRHYLPISKYEAVCGCNAWTARAYHRLLPCKLSRGQPLSHSLRGRRCTTRTGAAETCFMGRQAGRQVVLKRSRSIEIRLCLASYYYPVMSRGISSWRASTVPQTNRYIYGSNVIFVNRYFPSERACTVKSLRRFRCRVTKGSEAAAAGSRDAGSVSQH